MLVQPADDATARIANMKLIAYLAVTLGLIQSALAEDYAFDAGHWEFDGEISDRVEYKGQSALHFKTAGARVKGLTLMNGVIAFSEQRSFAGVVFREFEQNGKIAHDAGNITSGFRITRL